MKITENLIPRIKIEDFADKHGLELEIFERVEKDYCATGPFMRYYTHFKHSWIKEGPCLVGASGDGPTKNIAIENYKQRISNQWLVIDLGKNRKDIQVPNII